MDFGSAVIEVINNSNLKNVKVKTFGYGDCFVEHGSIDQLEEKYEINSDNILKAIKTLI